MTTFTNDPLASYESIDLIRELERRGVGNSAHVIDLTPDSWTIEHPLRDRLEFPSLADCVVVQLMEKWSNKMFERYGVGKFSIHPSDLSQVKMQLDASDDEWLL